MLIFAVISEIPFDLVSGDSVLYLFHQNVLWTFLIGLLLIALIDKVRKTGKVWLWIPVAIVVTLVGYVIGTITMVDFYGAGVVMVIMFYVPGQGTMEIDSTARVYVLYQCTAA